MCKLYNECCTYPAAACTPIGLLSAFGQNSARVPVDQNVLWLSGCVCFGLRSSVADKWQHLQQEVESGLIDSDCLQHGAVCVMMANKSTEIARNLRRHRRLLSGIQRLRFLHRCQCQQISGEREIIRLPAQPAKASQPRQMEAAAAAIAMRLSLSISQCNW